MKKRLAKALKSKAASLKGVVLPVMSRSNKKESFSAGPLLCVSQGSQAFSNFIYLLLR